MGYVDLHSHVLPALDDGSPDPGTTLTMLRGLAAMGFERVVATPHQKAAQFLPDWTQVTAALDRTRAESPIPVSLAAENYWDSVFFERSRDLSFPRYDGGRAFLFEIPTEDLPVRFEATLFDLCVKGLLPVMAHPERYRPFWDDRDTLARIGENVCLVVDLGAVAGYHGWRVGRVARALVADGLAHACASDAHTPGDLRLAAEGIAWIKKKLGPEAVTRLLDENPRRILAGEMP
jgi:protein-tyrosine phosphatase